MKCRCCRTIQPDSCTVYPLFLYCDYRYVQIIVVALKDTTLPDPPYTYTSDLISTANESVAILKPYVTAQLTVDEVNELNNFVVGDGRNCGHPARKRRGVEKFKRFDEVGGRRKIDRSEGSRKPTLFYNRPLWACSIYSAFQRTFVDGVWIFAMRKKN